MSFSDELISDLDVFFNEEEFAETHEFDGDNIQCVIDDDLLQENKLKSTDGIYKGVKMFHVKASQLKGKPITNGDKLTFDGEYYYVTDCVDTNGVYTITLSANKEV